MASLVTYPTRLNAEWTPSTTHTKAASSSSSLDHERLSVAVAVSGVTDAGSAKCKVNQDAFFTHCDSASSALVLGVFDGHGKEAGRDAALAARDYFRAHFQSLTRADYAALEQHPQSVFSSMFHSCHAALRSVLKSVYERRGFTVTEQGEYLVKRPANGSGSATSVRGGTTATLVVILDGGRVVLTANVGDSAAVLAAKASGSRHRILRASDALELPSHDNNSSADSDYGSLDHDDVTADKRHIRSRSSSEISTATRALVLTGEHAPDSRREFLRARAIRRSETNDAFPGLRFLFDACDPRVQERTLIFQVDAATGELSQRSDGAYLKNVRDEWATLVATPSDAPYPDSLAFTRSLGDFHMHVWGVNCEPSVHVLSLEAIARRTFERQRRHQSGHSNNQHDHEDDGFVSNTESDDNSSSGSESMDDTSDASDRDAVEFTLVAASDGVWDAWKYDDLFEFLDASDAKRRARATSGSSSDGPTSTPTDSYAVDRAVASLLKANLKRAQSIFGDDADNMTAMVCHFRVTPEPETCS